MRRVPLLVALGLSGCELITEAHEFEFHEGLCTECVEPDLKRAPCPTPSEAPDLDEDFVFAAEEGRFTGLDAQGRLPGLDRDCSAEAKPSRCRPRVDPPTNGWEPRPMGIDNSAAQRMFMPLEELAAAAGYESNLNLDYRDGLHLGLLVILRNYNGTPDDSSVEVSLHSSPGVSKSNGPPRWDGTDTWDLHDGEDGSPEPFLRIERAEGYVSGGVLVVDYRHKGQQTFRINTGFGEPFRLLVRDIVLVGNIDSETMRDVVFSAIADYDSLIESVPAASQTLAACFPEVVSTVEQLLGIYLEEAVDMPSATASSEDELCGGVSLAFSAWGKRARLGGFSVAAPRNCGD